MDKKTVAAVLEEIAILLELSGENPFKSRSYTIVARQITSLTEDINQLVEEKRLREIKGVGDALEQKITELVATGSLEYHQKLRGQFPESLFDLFHIPGLGAKRIKTLYEDLGVSSLGELEYACSENRLVSLKGFGSKMQQKVLEGIAFAKKHQGRFLYNRASKEAERLLATLREQEGVIRIATAGSLRRRKEVIKDVDIIVSSSEPGEIMAAFVSSENVDHITGHGDTKASVVLNSGIAADLRVVSDEQFPYALHHFTGSKEHNVAMRQRAKDRGLKLNEYGLFKGDEVIPCEDEAAIFAALDLPYIPPELREDMGEFDEAPPNLVGQDDLVGVFHCHTNFSDGMATVEEMAAAAEDRGYAYILIADHSQSAAYAGGLSPERVAEQHGIIDKFNKRSKGIRVLKGIESDIRADGSLDYDADVLDSFDMVVASVHSKLTMAEKEATKRVIRAVEDPHTSILGHPTGRLLLAREGYPLDFEKVFDACAANGVAVEINANPHRLDLDWRLMRRAKEKGVKLAIGPDAHNPEGLDDVAFGIGVARKGWVESGDLLNSMTLDELLPWADKR